MTGISFGRQPGETDEEWGAACKDMARALAKALGREDLLPSALAAGSFAQDREAGLGPKGARAAREAGNAQKPQLSKVSSNAAE